MGMIFWCGGDKQFGQIERKREQAVPTVQRVQFKTSDIYISSRVTAYLLGRGKIGPIFLLQIPPVNRVTADGLPDVSAPDGKLLMIRPVSFLQMEKD